MAKIWILVLLLSSTIACADELVLSIGNESNPVDGWAGPFTYGAHGEYAFTQNLSAEAVFMRLHEPGTSWAHSELDEAQLTLRAKDGFGFTLWRNRIVDMYTNLYGLEYTHELAADLSLVGGVYLGTATREEAWGRFQGGRVGVGKKCGHTEFELSGLFGSIDHGYYRHLELSSAIELSERFTLSFTLEERGFDFGNHGPRIEPADEYIFVTGLEANVL